MNETVHNGSMCCGTIEQNNKPKKKHDEKYNQRSKLQTMAMIIVIIVRVRSVAHQFLNRTNTPTIEANQWRV